MEQLLPQIAVQGFGMVIMGYVFLQIMKMVLDAQGKRTDRVVDALERLRDEVIKRI